MYKQVAMKYAAVASMILAAFLSGSCGKVDEYPFICEGFQQDAPTGDSADIKMPTAFTPNGDGLNDVLAPMFHDISSYSLTVYNIQERVIFTSTDPMKGYAASRPMDKDMYYYRIEAVSTKGNRVARCGSAYALNCLPAGSRLGDFVFGDQIGPYDPAVVYPRATAEVLTTCP
jgi:hypothetical protein